MKDQVGLCQDGESRKRDRSGLRTRCPQVTSVADLLGERQRERQLVLRPVYLVKTDPVPRRRPPLALHGGRIHVPIAARPIRVLLLCARILLLSRAMCF